MSNITYKSIEANSLRVYLDGHKVGRIERTSDGQFWYVPNGQKIGGDKFATVAEVKRSIEG